MMNKRGGDKQARYHIWLYEDDVNLVDSLYGNSLGRSTAIRLILRKALNNLKARAEGVAHTPRGAAELADRLVTEAGGQE